MVHVVHVRVFSEAVEVGIKGGSKGEGDKEAESIVIKDHTECKR